MLTLILILISYLLIVYLVRNSTFFICASFAYWLLMIGMFSLSNHLFLSDMENYGYEDEVKWESEFYDGEYLDGQKVRIRYENPNGELVTKVIGYRELVGDIDRPGRLKIVHRQFTTLWLHGNVTLHIIEN